MVTLKACRNGDALGCAVHPIDGPLYMILGVYFVVASGLPIARDKFVHITPQTIVHCVIFVTQVNSHHIVDRIRLATRIGARAIWIIIYLITN